VTTLLEQRYRRALTLLPAPYREAWADDMVATFLEGAYACQPDDPDGVDVSRPRLSELASIAALALRLRLGGVEAPARPRLWGDAVRLAALIGLLGQATLTLTTGLIASWFALHGPGTVASVPVAVPSRWETLPRLFELAWLPAFVLVLYGQLRWSRVLAAIGLAGQILAIGELMARGAQPSRYGLVLVVVSLAILAALGAYQPTSPTPAARSWLAALAVSVLAVLGVSLLPGDGIRPYLDVTALWCAGFVVVALIQRRRPDPVWALALALVGVAVIALRLGLTADLLDLLTARAGVVALTAVEVLAVLVVGGGCAAQARRHWRQLPPVTAELLSAAKDDQ
jgi:hypothetical protein